MLTMSLSEDHSETLIHWLANKTWRRNWSGALQYGNPMTMGLMFDDTPNKII